MLLHPENGDGNVLLGLAIDRTTVDLMLTDSRDDNGDIKLHACHVFMCFSLIRRQTCPLLCGRVFLAIIRLLSDLKLKFTPCIEKFCYYMWSFYSRGWMS